MDPDSPESVKASPPVWKWALGFLIVGACWGLTTPFMRKAAVATERKPKTDRPFLKDPGEPWIRRKTWSAMYAVIDLLKNPAYAIPLLLNLSAGGLFFLVIGQAELSLTVPITNSLAFLFTVLGEWWAEGKIVSRDTWLGIGLVLGGIGLCVHAKAA